MRRHIILLLCIIAAVLSEFSCSISVAGGSSSTDNGKIIGSILMENGQLAPNTQVMLIEQSYNPVVDEPVPDSFIDTTDQYGEYSFTISDTGVYSIQAVHLTQRTRLLKAGIIIDSQEDTLVIPQGTLKAHGVIKTFLPDTVDPVNGYIYIPGTTIGLSLSDASSFVLLDSVPAGTMSSLIYGSKISSIQKTIRYDVPVLSGDTTIVSLPTWKYSRPLYLNTTASGADVSGTVTDFPVLVRLTFGNFRFAEAKVGGEDIRFTKSNGVTGLPYEIEQWDATAEQAAVWVKVDTVYGNNSNQFITMYWGNPDANTASNSALVFDTKNGFQAVWHLSGAGNGACIDATLNQFNGTPSDTAPSVVTNAAIGQGQGFNGESNYFTIEGSASGKLNFPEYSTYSLSAWVKVPNLDSNFHVIVGKGNEQYGLQVTYLNRWHFMEFVSTNEWETVETDAQAGVWTLLTGVRDGRDRYLYVNGVLVDSVGIIHSSPDVQNYTREVMIGRRAPKEELDHRFFNGIIDEVRMANISYGPDWVRLCFMNQKADDALVEFR